MINKFKPELAKLVKAPPEGNEWLHEIKFDGYRILAFINKKRVKLISRNGKDWTSKFEEVSKVLQKLNISETILDGELVALDDEGKSKFQLLQNALSEGSSANLQYFVFDVPFYQGKNISGKSLLDRKDILKKILSKKRISKIHFSEYVIGNGDLIFKEACKKGLEGIMSKNIYSTYKQKRTADWVKVKCSHGQEFVIVGFTEPQHSRQFFGSLLLAYYKDGELIYCGHVGTGFNQKSLKEIHEKLLPLIQSKSSVKKYSDTLKRKVTWVKPKLVGEVEFTEWTDEGILRHPTFKGLRSDKTAKVVKLEEPEKTIKLSHSAKVLYPNEKITKLDLLNYYKKVSAYLLPYIKNRPISLVRCPNFGLTKCFYQKNWVKGLPESLSKVEVPTKKGKHNFLMINSIKGLLSTAQLDVLELHPWLSLKDKLDQPNQIVFDLDPSPEVSWKDLVNAAVIFRKLLKKLNLQSFVKLTGGKGLHIVIPIQRQYTFPEIKKFTKEFGKYITQQYPEQFTINLKKESRKNKIFIDYLRNDYGATAIACFSPRAREHAHIAVPISWGKLTKARKPLFYTINTIDKYFKDFPEDPWKEFFKIKQKISKTLIVFPE